MKFLSRNSGTPFFFYWKIQFRCHGFPWHLITIFFYSKKGYWHSKDLLWSTMLFMFRTTIGFSNMDICHHHHVMTVRVPRGLWIMWNTFIIIVFIWSISYGYVYLAHRFHLFWNKEQIRPKTNSRGVCTLLR